jgi:CelD/BcsL family acetyltransferase involved in cellulose biosynthesis
MVSGITDREDHVAGAGSLGLSVRETNPCLDPRWESFVMQHPGASVYHHPAWLASLEQECRQPSVYLICEDAGGKLFGVFPLIYTRGVPFRKGDPLSGARLSSLPRTPLAGPLTTDRRATTLLLEEAVRRASDSHVRLQIKTQGEELSGMVDGVVTKPWRLTYLLHLPEDPEEPFRVPNSQSWASIKRAVKKATANGLRTRLAETEPELAAWYTLYLETMRRNVVPARSYRVFKALWERMRPTGLMRLLLAEQETAAGSRIIGGCIFFYLGQTVTYAFGASQTSDLGLRPNDIIFLEAINHARRNGFRILDFGEVPDGEDGLVRFKSKWGSEPVRLYRYYFPGFAENRISTGNSESLAQRTVKAIWRRLPLRITSWVGERVYARL